MACAAMVLRMSLRAGSVVVFEIIYLFLNLLRFAGVISLPIASIIPIHKQTTNQTVEEQHMSLWKNLALLGVAVGAATFAQAKDINYNIIQLSDSAQMTVPQNQLNVTLAVESDAANRDQASRDNTLKLNRVLVAIEQAGLKGQLLNRSVNEQIEYSNNKRESRGWRDYAQVSVYSEDTAKVNQAVAQVQQDARIESQSYGLTTVARRQYEMRLTEQAIRNFQQQAQHITGVLGAKRYKIVDMNVGDANVSMRPRMYAANMAKMEMDASGSAPVARDMAGETEITVNVSGSIQVQ